MKRKMLDTFWALVALAMVAAVLMVDTVALDRMFNTLGG